jgi:hypothetical protein
MAMRDLQGRGCIDPSRVRCHIDGLGRCFQVSERALAFFRRTGLGLSTIKVIRLFSYSARPPEGFVDVRVCYFDCMCGGGLVWCVDCGLHCLLSHST